MRLPYLACMLMLTAAAIAAQTASDPLPSLPSDPQGMFAAAEPLYRFDDPAVVPWHLKGSYQLYDDSGKPSSQGTYEFWWAAPGVYRSTWTREDATRSEWHTADGKVFSASTGDRLFYLEHQIANLLFAPLSDSKRSDPADLEIIKSHLQAGKVELPCAAVQARKRPEGAPPFFTYCFDPSQAVLRIKIVSGVNIVFDDLGVTQHRILSRNITASTEGKKLFTFTVKDVSDLSKNDPATAPPSDAKPEWAQDSAFASGKRASKTTVPIYPPAAKMAGISGIVVLDAMIGTDGRVNDIRVLATPSPLLAGAAKDAVKHWQYTPSEIDGQPVAVNALIDVVFSLSH